MQTMRCVACPVTTFVAPRTARTPLETAFCSGCGPTSGTPGRQVGAARKVETRGDAARAWQWLPIDEEAVLQASRCGPQRPPATAEDNVHSPKRVAHIALNSAPAARALGRAQTGLNLGLARPGTVHSTKPLSPCQRAFNATPGWTGLALAPHWAQSAVVGYGANLRTAEG